MAAAAYITNTRDAVEVCIDSKATKEIVLVGPKYIGATAIKIVSRTIRNATPVRIVGERFVTSGETIP